MAQVFVHGVRLGSPANALAEAIRGVLLEATDDLAWLAAGDTVLLKPALNSGDRYPATTHPQSLVAVASLLKQRGAKVVVGDKPGVADVLCDRNGSHKRASRTLFDRSGMNVGDLRFVGFEERGWDDGFCRFEHPSSSWPDGFYLTRWLDEVDHMINLPRVSSHVQTGVTLGFKNFVGLLRDDSRMCFHANGPYRPIIKAAVKRADLDTSDDGADAFFDKITDISLATNDKLRCTLFTATKAQVTLGPDKYSLPIGNAGLLRAHVQEPDTGLVFASSDQVAAEVTAIGFLISLHERAPWLAKLRDRVVHSMNPMIGRLGSYGPWEHPFVRRALALGLGSGAFETRYTNTPHHVQHQLNQRIRRADSQDQHS